MPKWRRPEQAHEAFGSNMETKSTLRGGTLLVFDPHDGGHHSGYVLHLLRNFHRESSLERICLAVPESMVSIGSEVHKALQAYSPIEVSSISFRDELFNRFRSCRALAFRAFIEYRLLQESIAAVRPDHCLAMYIDHLLVPLALGLKPSCNLSGIYFRPTFHYSQFTYYCPTIYDRLRAIRQRVVTKRALRLPELTRLFCLDPLAPKAVNEMCSEDKATWLPDPVHLYPQNENARRRTREALGVEPGRIVLLQFGAVVARKGVFDVFDAAHQLSSDMAGKITLLLVGPVPRHVKAKFQSEIARLRRLTDVQVLIEERFIPDEEIQAYFQASDVVLTLYRRHVGMSAVLVRSAAAGKPVISSGYGLLGELVRRWHLGVTVEDSASESIVSVMENLVRNGSVPFDREKAAAFANANSAELYSRVIYQNLPEIHSV